MPKPLTRIPRCTADPALDATLLAIAQLHLRLETLETRNADRLDFHEHSAASIRSALLAAFEAGRRCRNGAKPKPPIVRSVDLVLTSPKPSERRGTYLDGVVPGFRFCAKVFPEHAENPDYEIGRSRISHLAITRTSDDATAYLWDRGLGLGPIDAHAVKALDIITRRLANLVFGPAEHP